MLVTAQDGTEHEIAFEEDAYALSLAGGYEYAPPVIRFVYESPTTPKQWFDYDMASRKRTLRKTQEIPSGHDPKAYVTRRLYATASDGAVTGFDRLAESLSAAGASAEDVQSEHLLAAAASPIVMVAGGWISNPPVRQLQRHVRWPGR